VTKKLNTKHCGLSFIISYVPGTVDKGVVEVTNSFGVPHKEYEDTVSTFA
jgi:hypothetical protein